MIFKILVVFLGRKSKSKFLLASMKSLAVKFLPVTLFRELVEVFR